MRRRDFVVLSLLLGACGGATAGGSASTDGPSPATLEAAGEILRLEEAWGRALSTGDTAFFHRTLADDFTGTGGPAVQTKAMVIEELARRDGQVPVPKLEQTQVKVYGDVGVVTGVAVYPAAPGTDAQPSRTRFTEVWVKRGGTWQAVHGHYNPIPPRDP